MGVLRIREAVDELVEKDPYELFSLDEPRARWLRGGALKAALGGVVVACVTAGAVLWSARHQGDEGDAQPHAYFEVRVIDPDGRPVAGAKVRSGEKQLGVTDSFGEWRRFMRVTLGATVPLTISKKAGGGVLSAVKNLAVPARLPKDGELEVSGSVQLDVGGAARGGNIAVHAASTGRAAAATAAADAVASRAARADERRDGKIVAVEASGRNVADVVLPAAASTAQMRAVTPSAVATPGALDLAHIAFVIDGAPTPALEAVQAAMVRRSLELGMLVDPDSALHVILQHLPGQAPGGADQGLIGVRGIYADATGATPLFSFVRNYQDSPLASARDVLWAATLHVRAEHPVQLVDGEWRLGAAPARLWALTPGRMVASADGRLYRVESESGSYRLGGVATLGSPCAAGQSACVVRVPGLDAAPPVAGWKRLPLRVLGGASDVAADFEIFVSGWLAHRQADGNYTYWGQPRTGANVTVVRGGRILQRGRIDAAAGAPPAVSLPSAPLSRR
jgi:hypothetical protein